MSSTKSKSTSLTKLIGVKCDIYNVKLNKWLTGSIINGSDKIIKVHYDGRSSECDEWIQPNKTRIARIHTHTKKTETTNMLSKRANIAEEKYKKYIGRKYDAYSVKLKQWLSCCIIDAKANSIKVNYDGYSSKYDECIHDIKRFASLHTKSKKSKSQSTRSRAAQQQTQKAKLRLEALEKKKKKLKKLIGTRCDVYNEIIKQWWPCTVIKSNDTEIKVKYDGYSSKYDEWINPKSDRYATIHKHTKNHQMHQKLSVEAKKRKTEWNKLTQFNSKSDTLVSSSVCPYYQACNELMKIFVNYYMINIAMFEPNGHRCFCQNCHENRRDKEIYSIGKPSQTYVLPIGYARFGIKLSSDQIKENILSDWHVVYHGTKSAFLPEICRSGLILLKPDDFKLNGSKHQKNKTRSGHIQERFVRINKYTKEKEIFDPNQIFTSSSCIYSSFYCDTTIVNDHKVSFMFQCRQKSGTYRRGQETMGFGDKKIDEWISNDSIEFYTKHNLYIIITGILIKIHDFDNAESDEESKSESDEESEIEAECAGCDGSGRYKIGECFKCHGTGKCFKCKGSRIFKKALSCNSCDGIGVFRNGQNCRKCKGSGIYKPPIKCKFCKGDGGCNKCNDTGKFTVTCKRCAGTGSYYY